jgi:putative membrane protein
MTGAAFDKEFASFMVDDHKKAIAMFEQEAASSDPAQVTALATKTLPTLKAHLAKAQSLQ